MIKLIDLLPKALFQEAKIIPTGIGIGRILPKEYTKLVSDLAEDVFEGISGSGRDNPITVDYDMNEYCDEDNYDIDEGSKCDILQKLFKKYPNGGKFISNDVFGFVNFAPGISPDGKFTELIEIDPKYKIITISVPHISYAEYNTGWFDRSGNYYPDTNNFDERGNYIENA